MKVARSCAYTRDFDLLAGANQRLASRILLSIQFSTTWQIDWPTMLSARNDGQHDARGVQRIVVNPLLSGNEF